MLGPVGEDALQSLDGSRVLPLAKAIGDLVPVEG